MSFKISQGYIFIFRGGAEKIEKLLRLNSEMKYVSFVCMKYPNIWIIHAIFIHADKTKYMFMYRDQNAGRSHNMKVD